MIGKTLSGKYRIESLIGTGGMAKVYKATQLKNKRTVAIKMLKEEYRGDAEFLRRFEREAQAVLTLSHENIVRSYDVGEADGCPYIVLEYVQGDTLKNIIKEKGPLPWKEAVHIAAQVLDGLGHAHAGKIIHRDVKSQNVLVTAQGRAKLTDFGIARDAQAETVTFSGRNVLGSVHYLSPEQARGGVVDVESDIYSMGITLYEMVTGDLPFKGDNTVTVALKHLHDEIRPPMELQPELPRAINDIILKATMKDPALRYHSAKAMRQDLLRALREPNGRFVTLDAASAPEHPAHRRSRRTLLGIGIGVAAIVAAIVVVFLFVSTVSAQDTKPGMLQVPQLEGKTLTEAKEYAQSRGFTTEIDGWEPSDTVEKDVIIRQEPAAGSSAKENSGIRILVSTGSDVHVLPDFTGYTLAEAQEALQQMGLERGEIFYQNSSLEAGLICRQNPAEGTELMTGDSVDLYISGEPSQNIEMPPVTGLSLSKALSALHEKGFSNVWVYDAAEVSEDVADDVVLQQTPAAEEVVARNTRADLTLNNKKNLFSADIAFNVDSEERGTRVTVTCLRTSEDGVLYEQFLYETTVSTGKQIPISFRGVLDSPGDYEVIIYKNGEELTHKSASFAYRN